MGGWQTGGRQTGGRQMGSWQGQLARAFSNWTTVNEAIEGQDSDCEQDGSILSAR